MDGPHDLGGKGDFGPIDTAAPEFRHEWERRQWALTKTMNGPAIPIDWFRHALETMPPAVYLSVPYFQKWNANAMALFVDAGALTLDEIARGKAETAGPAAPVFSTDQLEEKQRRLNADFRVDIDAPPAFQTGDRVTTGARPSPGHTRLPAYARAATGTVIAHHGAHLYADAGARGEHIGHHLYTVEFAAPDLWPEADAADTVCLDLWEPYLAPAR